MRVVALLAGLVVLIGVGLWFLMIRMPGESYSRPLPSLSQVESSLSDQLRMHVHKLAAEIGERNLLRCEALSEAKGYLEEVLTFAGYEVRGAAPSLASRVVTLQIVSHVLWRHSSLQKIMEADRDLVFAFLDEVLTCFPAKRRHLP